MYNSYRDQELKGATSGRDKRMLLARKQFGQGRVSYLLWDKLKWNLNYKKSQDSVLSLIQSRSFPKHIFWRSQILATFGAELYLHAQNYPKADHFLENLHTASAIGAGVAAIQKYSSIAALEVQRGRSASWGEIHGDLWSKLH